MCCRNWYSFRPVVSLPLSTWPFAGAIVGSLAALLVHEFSVIVGLPKLVLPRPSSSRRRARTPHTTLLLDSLTSPRFSAVPCSLQSSAIPTIHEEEEDEEIAFRVENLKQGSGGLPSVGVLDTL